MFLAGCQLDAIQSENQTNHVDKNALSILKLLKLELEFENAKTCHISTILKVLRKHMVDNLLCIYLLSTNHQKQRKLGLSLLFECNEGDL